MLRRTVGVVSFTLAACLLAPGTAARASGSSDLQLVRIRASDTAVAPGGRIRFVAVARNAEPDDLVNDSLNITYSRVRHLDITSVHCSDGVSPDTPSCEFGAVPAGDSVRMIVVGHARTATYGTNVRIRFCVSNEAATAPDPNHANDCLAAAVPISADS